MKAVKPVDSSESIKRDFTPAEREALDWLGLMYSGNATAEDIVALERWCRQSHDHAQAFALAGKIRKFTGTHDFSEEMLVPVPLLQRPVTRRIALGGAAVATAGYALVQPPLKMWSSLAELSSDYRTRVGERQSVTLAQGLSVDLNTATSVSLRNRPRQPGIEMVAGEVAVDANLPAGMQFIVYTGDGRVLAQRARFDLRLTERGFYTTCVDGNVIVTQRQGKVELREGQAVGCIAGASTLGGVQGVNAMVVTAWRRGELIFHDTPLRDIIAEINRYRHGRIVLLNSEIGNRRLSGNIGLNQLDDMAAHLAGFAHVSATALPGNIIFLS